MRVCVGAPGKVILCGEHAVVHGCTAVALSLGLRTYVCLSPGSSPGFRLDLPDVGLAEHIPADVVRSFRPTGGAVDVASPPPLSTETRAALASCAGSLPMAAAQAKSAFVYLAAHLLPDNESTWSLAVRATSMLPIGAGLGSSASYCTALAGALLRLRSLTLGTGTPSRTHVNAWAFRAEQIIHGNPSGVDNHAATWGGALSFRGGNVKVLKNVKAMNFLLTNTRVPRSTRDLVAAVGRRLETHPAPMKHILSAVQSISDDVLALLAGLPTATDESRELARLETLMAMNHGLLNAMGVGHAALEAVCQITAAAGLQSKLTGAGGGGCAITLLRAGADVDRVQAALAERGFECFRADVGVQGVTAYDADSGADNAADKWAPIEGGFLEQ